MSNCQQADTSVVPVDAEDAARMMRRIRAEFDEMPGLCLTMSQAARLFGLPAEKAVVLLNSLVATKLLRVTRGGYVRT